MSMDALPIESATPHVPATHRRSFFDLFLISFVILFFELTAIRYFAAEVVFLTFFTNIVLIACFVGMTVGLLASSRKQDLITLVLPFAFIAATLAQLVFAVYHARDGLFMIDTGNQQSPAVIFFGTEYRTADPTKFVVPIWAVGGVFFALIAVMFVGLGQVMGRAFDAIPARIGAYTVNILGSIAGIVVFGLASWLETSPHLWFLVCVGTVLYFLPRWTRIQVISQVGVMFVVAMSAYTGLSGSVIRWSPYYKISYDPRQALIVTNGISHQFMTDLSKYGGAYSLPHLLNSTSGGSPFERALIIGAGSGTDVQAALMGGVKHVDAVEIDPVIADIGRRDHPNQPYDPKNPVALHFDDGRSFLKKHAGDEASQYDIVIYALVDSLVLHSGYSSLRLESFLFTEQAFADVHARLKPGGVFVMYNYYRQGWVVGRLRMMAEKVFGADAIVMSHPHQGEITPADNQANHITFLFIGKKDAAGGNATIERIRKRFESSPAFWLNDVPSAHAGIDAFGASPPGNETRGWHKIAPAHVDTSGIDRLPSDNWPFLYLKEARIPWEPSGLGMVVIGVLSILVLLIFAPVRAIRPNGQMFFLGAGFMLLQTKGVVHMALLFGSTWVVNSVVFFAMLVMILIANLFVLMFKPTRLWPLYALLVGALLLNALVPMEWFLSLGGWSRTVVSCVVVFLPILFAGIIFATSFRDVISPPMALGSNIAGVILGGLSENLSMIVGFQYLLLLAIVFYALSSVLRPRVAAVASA